MSLEMIPYTEFDDLLRNLNWEQPQPFWLSSQATAFEQMHRRFGVHKLPILQRRLDWLKENQA
jgi:hypothetical protein|tara:strand:- start:6829 stop:7017 length:189 start_codon:yes stop_codon:yes gene_type:complete